MTEPGPIVARYDRDAALYERHWQPVLDASARALLDRVEPLVARLPRLGSPDPVLVDLGTGTGALAVAAVQRWPGLRVIGVDPSAGMIAVARDRARVAELPDEARLEWLAGPAEEIPLPDGSVDLVVSSFVLQLVDDRARALSEAARVLRRGGRLAFVTWLDRGGELAADDEFDEAVFDLDIAEPDEPDDDVRAGDFKSVRQAERELRAAGFEQRSVRRERLVHRWAPEAYLRFKIEYDERALFESLDAAASRRLQARVWERWATLDEEAFTFRSDLVSAVSAVP